MGLLGRPVPRDSWAAWSGEPQALSPVAATTCRVRIAAWKARRGSSKVGLNETFTAKFQHLYTTLTWRFWGWVEARETLSVVSLPLSSFGLHPSLEWSWTLASFVPELDAAVALRAQGNGARGVLDVQVP